MRRIDLEEEKRIQIEILDDIHVFCEDHNLVYSLAYGSLLGAVRHGGYIPWDDDIDIVMPREDYEILAQTYVSDINRLIDLRKSDSTVEQFFKVARTGSIMVDSIGRHLWGINIDVFPIDGCPDNYKTLFKKIEEDQNKLPRVCPFYKDVSRNKNAWMIKYYLKRLRFFYYPNVLELKREIETLSTTCSFKDSSLACVMNVCKEDRKPIRSEIFRNRKKILFEGKEYWAIQDYDSYLKALYGDYMTLPPEEARFAPHFYDAFIEY